MYFNFPTAKADNSLLWDSSGNWKAPSSSGYQIDYAAILNFIKNVGPSIFPSQLQSGRIRYYSSIPSTIDTSVWPPTDLNQRFWKDYIDYVLGVMQVSYSGTYIVINNGNTGYTGYGQDFQWGTVKITALSSLSGSPKPYMHYGDNPQRPLLSFWFGPMTMIDFLGNYNLWYTGYGNDASRYCWWPGTCHESPMYACKLGIQAALNDMQNNHPNDLISLIMFSTPLTQQQRHRRRPLQSRPRGTEPKLFDAHGLALVSAGHGGQFHGHRHPLRRRTISKCPGPWVAPAIPWV